ANAELAATYAALILADDGIEITSEKILALTNAADVELEPIWATLLAKALEGKNVKELLSNVGSGGGGPAVGGGAAPAAAGGGGGAAAAAEEKVEEKKEEKEESDDDMIRQLIRNVHNSNLKKSPPLVFSTMSTSASAPSNDSSAFMLFGIDTRLVPVIAALVGFFVVAILLVVLLCFCHMRRQAALLRDPEYIAAMRQVELLRLQKEGLQMPRPTMTTLFLDPIQSQGKDWKDVVPLGVEASSAQDQESPSQTPSPNSSEDVRVVMIVMLPDETRSTLGRAPAELPDSKQNLGVETAFGVIERKTAK
ncbi:hypothetical protein FRC17_006156, partial [Serendipita sp. 399]